MLVNSSSSDTLREQASPVGSARSNGRDDDRIAGFVRLSDSRGELSRSQRRLFEENAILDSKNAHLEKTNEELLMRVSQSVQDAHEIVQRHRTSEAEVRKLTALVEQLVYEQAVADQETEKRVLDRVERAKLSEQRIATIGASLRAKADRARSVHSCSTNASECAICDLIETAARLLPTDAADA